MADEDDGVTVEFLEAVTRDAEEMRQSFWDHLGAKYGEDRAGAKGFNANPHAITNAVGWFAAEMAFTLAKKDPGMAEHVMQALLGAAAIRMNMLLNGDIEAVPVRMN
jgi:hypothetical protein